MNFWKKSLVARLVISFLILSLLTVGLVGAIAYLQAREALKQAVFEELSVAANLKTGELDRWVEDQRQQVEFLAGLSCVTANLETMMAHEPSEQAYQAAYTDLDEFLASTLALHPSLQEILILGDPGGQILLSTEQSHEGDYRVKDTFFLRGKEGTFIQNVYSWPVTLKPTMTISTPLLDADGQRIGVLAIHLNLTRMDEIVLQNAGLGQSGETYLVDSTNVFVSAERFGRREFPRGVHTEGIDAALQGQNGSGLYANYAGTPVVGTYRWLQDRELALLAEMSQQEAFAPARRLLWTIFLSGFVFSCLLAVGMYLLARQIARPILMLAEAADQAAEGDLDQTVPVLTQDEIGTLATAFNRMTAQLRVLYHEIQRSAEHFRRLIEHASDVISITDEHGTLLYASPSFERVLGYRPSELRGTSTNELIHPDDRLGLRDTFARIIAHPGTIPPIEYRIRHKDGAWRVFESVGNNLLADDTVKGIVLNSRDVTERRQVEEALRRERDVVSRMMETSPAGIVMLDSEGQIAFANSQAEQVLGLTRTEISQRTYNAPEWRITDYDGHPFPEAQLPFAQVMRTGQPVSSVRHAIEWPDGERVLLSINAAPILDESGQVDGVVTTVADVTAQVQARRALQKSEARYRAVSELTSDLTYSLHLAPDGSLTADWVTGALTRITGYTLEELKTSGGWKTLIHPKDLPILLQRASEMTEGSSATGELRILAKNGDTRWLRVHGQAIQARDPGQPTQIIGAVKDITGRKQAEEALRISEARFRNIIESTPLGIHMYQLEPDDRLVFIGANPAADEILGVDNAQFVGQTIEQAFPDLTNTVVPERYRRAAAQGEPWHTDQIIYEENEISGAFEVHAFQTSPGKMVASFLDITERKRAETEILRLQHLLQNITDSMPSALITLDPRGRVVTWNPAAETLTGQTAEQVQGQILWQACPGLARYRDLFDRVLAEHQTAHLHRDPQATEAGIVYHEVSAFPLVANAIEGAVLRIDDVTSRVQLEEMMLQSAKMASVGGLAAGMAHEINNPLAAMMQSAQILQVALDPQRPRTRQRLQDHSIDPHALDRYLQERGLNDYLAGIRETGGRAAKIVSDLLSFSRKTTSDVIPYDLSRLVEQTIDLAAADYDLKKKYDFRDIDILRDFEPNMPMVTCDGQQIQQVVLNLVRNATQAMAGKKDQDQAYQPRLTLRTSLRRGAERGWFRLEVQDNGPGIPQAVHARLFEPFFTTKEVDEGTGLGLWLCWSIVVERHKGRIWAESPPEGGTRFVVELAASGG